MSSVEKIKKLFAKSDITVNSKVDDRIVGDALTAFNKSEKIKSLSAELNIWRMIMKSKITNIAATAVIIMAVVVSINFLGGSPDGSSVAWSEVLGNIEKAKTLSWKSTLTEEGKSTVIRYKVLEPYLMRAEWSDGKIQIWDHQKQTALLLEPADMTATVLYTGQESLNFYDQFLQFKDKPKSVKQISNRYINGKLAIGFDVEAPSYLRGGDRHYGVMDNNEPIVELKRIVWVDSETLLPVLIEETVVGAEGRIVHVSTDEIVFDAELDESLFSLEVPAGYELQHESEMYDRMKSAWDMNQILKACMIYDNQHGHWPNSLQDLQLPGIHEDSYIYLKPSTRQGTRRVVLYDVYDVWKGGINVGFTDYRVEFIEDESKFKQLLGQR
jgi:hypothetical protein